MGVARSKPNPNAWTPNQIVGYRVAQARLLRGWTQDQAAAELEPFLGVRLSPASFSAIERSFQGGRVRQFSADEVVALARGFGLPVGWFFTPPPRYTLVTVKTPDHENDGLDPLVLIDLVLGDADTLTEWAHALVEFSQLSSSHTRLAGQPSVSSTDDPKMPDRLNELVRLRTRERMAELFGDTEKAKRVLAGLVAALGEVEAEFDIAPESVATPTDTKRRKAAR